MVYFLAFLCVYFDDVAGGVANQPQQKPGKADDNAYIAYLRHEIEDGAAAFLAHDVGRQGKADQPDDDRYRPFRRFNQRIVPWTRGQAGEFSRIAQQQVGYRVDQSGREDDYEDLKKQRLRKVGKPQFIG